MRGNWRHIAAVVGILLVAGCDKGSEPAKRSSRETDSLARSGLAEAPISQSLPAAITAGKVELRDGNGEEVFSFKPKEGDSAKFYDQHGNELCKLTFVDGKLKVKSPDDKPLFELKKKSDKVMIKDAGGENELFKFKLKGENIDFYAPGDRRLYRIRKKDYGYALEDNQDHTLFRAKVKDGKIVLRDGEDVTVLACKDITEPLGLVFFRMKELSLPQQAACFLFFLGL